MRHLLTESLLLAAVFTGRPEPTETSRCGHDRRRRRALRLRLRHHRADWSSRRSISGATRIARPLASRVASKARDVSSGGHQWTRNMLVIAEVELALMRCMAFWAWRRRHHESTAGQRRRRLRASRRWTISSRRRQLAVAMIASHSSRGARHTSVPRSRYARNSIDTFASPNRTE